MAASENSEKRFPAFATAALLAPLVGGVLGVMVVAEAGWPNMVLGIYVLPAFALCGLILSLIGIVVRESFRVLSWFALFLNSAALWYGISSLLHASNT